MRDFTCGCSVLTLISRAFQLNLGKQGGKCSEHQYPVSRLYALKQMCREGSLNFLVEIERIHSSKKIREGEKERKPSCLKLSLPEVTSVQVIEPHWCPWQSGKLRVKAFMLTKYQEILLFLLLLLLISIVNIHFF